MQLIFNDGSLYRPDANPAGLTVNLGGDLTLSRLATIELALFGENNFDRVGVGRRLMTFGVIEFLPA